ncbi:MAG TPA: PspA/IM30 family protein [Polyangiaceae bacterium]|jgi:phage shock protein A|nr:PspA/IM30 family protein [Polyangiaceae bacterium]
MAQGFFSRMGNLWRGFLSLWVSDVERNNPEIAYENAINSMVEKYTGLKRATASIIRRREDLEARHAAQAKELAQTALDLTVAVETNQDDLAVVLIQKKNQLDSQVAELEGEMQAAIKDADSAKASLMQVQTEIKKLRSEKDAMLARLQSAQARIRIQEQLEGLSVESEVKALENVREHIKTTVAQANLDKELSETSLEKRLAGLRAQSGEVAARQQLEQLKAAAATKALGQKKTM